MPLILLIGASEDKDIDGILEELLPRCIEVVFTKSIHPRALEPEKIKEKAQNYIMSKQVIQPLENALEYIIQSAGGDSAILVTGSIFIAAAALELLPTMIQKNVSKETEFSPDKEERTI
jgi:dihydrofolate synthase / folylpolyglutamate synthase